MIKLASEPEKKRCLAIDKNKLKLKKCIVYIIAIDKDTKELLALEASC